MFQEVYKSKIKWKQQIYDNLQVKFSQWMSPWPNLASIYIPRQVTLLNYYRMAKHRPPRLLVPLECEVDCGDIDGDTNME